MLGNAPESSVRPTSCTAARVSRASCHRHWTTAEQQDAAGAAVGLVSWLKRAGVTVGGRQKGGKGGGAHHEEALEVVSRVLLLIGSHNDLVGGPEGRRREEPRAGGRDALQRVQEVVREVQAEVVAGDGRLDGADGATKGAARRDDVVHVATHPRLSPQLHEVRQHQVALHGGAGVSGGAAPFVTWEERVRESRRFVPGSVLFRSACGSVGHGGLSRRQAAYHGVRYDDGGAAAGGVNGHLDERLHVVGGASGLEAVGGKAPVVRRGPQRLAFAVADGLKGGNEGLIGCRERRGGGV